MTQTLLINISGFFLALYLHFNTSHFIKLRWLFYALINIDSK